MMTKRTGEREEYLNLKCTEKPLTARSLHLANFFNVDALFHEVKTDPFFINKSETQIHTYLYNLYGE